MSDHELNLLTQRLIENVETVIVGKRTAVELSVATLLSGGHMLIEDIPGVGKTMLARALAGSIGGQFKRIQFTPDLLPADITGVSIYNQDERAFEFVHGPIFANVVLADEINRATPKSQSALLEAMEEFQVTADGETRHLPRPFFVIATENPIEYEGTFSLPEAQLDRFMSRVSIGYPTHDDEVDVLSRQMLVHPIERLNPVLSTEDVASVQEAVREIEVDDSLKHYAVKIVGETRTHPDVELGASPRGSIALIRLSQALAAISGRGYIIPDDVKRVAVPALAHRVVVKPDRRIQGVTSERVVLEILDSVSVPISEGVR
ncbi:MAG: MoxR family ATPase [Armatimonadetes bacterium]|jgi:MoxR-like ATPase|nr:MoxR family ATPase [Armatimonadota bacterium]MDI9584082.1 MoxR family ATPase [Acidobacteriota bacterium]